MSAQCPSLPKTIYLSGQLNLGAMICVAVCDEGSVCVPCKVQNAKAYLAGCQVAKCNIGWKVSDDKAKCEANQCSCRNGVGASEATCPEDGTAKCESCDAGFKLASDNISCPGTLWWFSRMVTCPTCAYFERIMSRVQRAMWRTPRATVRGVKCRVVTLVGR